MSINNNNKVIIQSLLIKVEDDYSMAEKYYALLSTVNSLNLTPREIQLVAFTAINGNISYSSVREEFCNRFNSTSATINNMISKLKKMKVLVKDETKVKVNPVILLNFKENIKLEINIEHYGNRRKESIDTKNSN